MRGMGAVLALIAAGTALAQEPVLIEYRDKPPYSYTENGQPKGFLLLKTMDAFHKLDITVKVAEAPLKRILSDIQANEAAICSPGWYKLPEREQFARFSASIFQDPPQVVIVSPKSVLAVRAHHSLRELIADKTLTVGAVEGISYGPELDALLGQAAKPAMRAPVPPIQLAKMVAYARADYMFIDQDDFSVIEQTGDLAKLGLKRVDFKDAPPGLKRYVICSKKVDEATLSKLNQALGSLR